MCYSPSWGYHICLAAPNNNLHSIKHCTQFVAVFVDGCRTSAVARKVQTAESLVLAGTEKEIDFYPLEIQMHWQDFFFFLTKPKHLWVVFLNCYCVLQFPLRAFRVDTAHSMCLRSEVCTDLLKTRKLSCSQSRHCAGIHYRHEWHASLKYHFCAARLQPQILAAFVFPF